MNNFCRNILALFIVLLAFAAIALLFSCCGVIKTKSSLKVDSVSVIKNDSGRVIKSEISQKNTEDWFREWMTNVPPSQPGKDTYHETTTQLQPLYLYREGGSKSAESNIINLDSFWRKKTDSINAQKELDLKTVERDGFTLMHLIGAAAAGGIIIGVVFWMRSNFIIKKVVKEII